MIHRHACPDWGMMHRTADATAFSARHLPAAGQTED